MSGEIEKPVPREVDELHDGCDDVLVPAFADVVVVGGGLSGLTAAWRLQDVSVVLLEQALEVGGNARFESHGKLRFPTAGSCLQLPAPGSRIAAVLQDLGLWNCWRSSAKDTQVLFRTGVLVRNIGVVSWAFLKQPKSLLNPKVYALTGSLVQAVLRGRPYVAAAKQLGDPIFSELYAYLARLAPGQGRYPSVPWSAADGWTRAEMEQFDSITLEQLLFDSRIRAALPADLRPPRRLDSLVRDAIATTLRVESLTLDDVSGYVGLHFLIGYLYGSLVAFPGGNGFVSDRLRQILETRDDFHCAWAAQVTSVRRNPAGGYRVVFRRQGRDCAVNARAVVWAAPKHAALDAIPDLPPAQRTAMAEIEYGDYAVANVILKRPVWQDHFGGYIIDGEGDPGNPMNWCRTGGCIVANWLDPERRHPAGVLTLLKPVARREHQGQIAEASSEALQQAVHAEISDMLTTAGVSPDVIEDIRLWQWPKGLVSPRPGQMKSDLFLRASASWDGIVFANQDTYGVGNFEAAVNAGMDAADHVMAEWHKLAAPAGKGANLPGRYDRGLTAG